MITDPDSSTSPKQLKNSNKKQKMHRHRSISQSSSNMDNMAEGDVIQANEYFEGLDNDKRPLLAGRRTRTSTEASNLSYGSSRLSFLSRNSGEITQFLTIRKKEQILKICN